MLLVLIKYGFFLWIAWSLLRVFLHHSIAAHWVALKKFIFLWLVSTSPVICAALLAKPQQDIRPNVPVGEQFDQTVFSAFSLGEQFVYSAAFIAPVLYVFLEAILIAVKEDPSNALADAKMRLRGFGSLLLPSIILIVFTVLSFAASKNPETFSQTFLSVALSTKSLAVYGFSLGLWYAAILLDTLPNMDFAEETRDKAKRFSEALKDRLRRGTKA